MFRHAASTFAKNASAAGPAVRSFSAAAARAAVPSSAVPKGYGSVVAAAAAAAAVAAATATSDEALCGYGPIATIKDIKDIESKMGKMEAKLEAKWEADIAYPGRRTNSAFVFIKPKAVTPKAKALLESSLVANGITVLKSGELSAKTIDKEMLIDNHYGAIASKAVKLQPSELNVSQKAQDAFKDAFGLEWSEAVASGKVYNAVDGCKKLGVNPKDMEAKYWSKLTKGKDLIKFGGGFYCGKVGEDTYVINGFYMSMRSVFTTPPAKIIWYSVEWPAASLSWEDFRGKVLGGTDPKEAAPGSARREILDNWKALGLKEEPNVGDNGVHASASPFEALAERMNWLGADLESDGFGSALLGAGVDKDTIMAWTQDPSVPFEGKKTSLFDLLEDMDSKACIEKAVAIASEK